MTEEILIEKGYIARELPPQFVTYPLSNKLSLIKTTWNSKLSTLPKDRKQHFFETKSTVFNIPKVGLLRRVISVPNPIHQTALVELIINKWNEIELIFNKSNSSFSKPIKDNAGIRAFVTEHNFSSFNRSRFIGSFDNYHQVKSDISKFYPSIYTHSIPWIIHTKPIAKANRNDFTLLGNLIDKTLRAGNSGQTIGIPIGPDTSLVIAEIINCEVDCILQNKFRRNNIKFFRFIDDIYIYCDSYTDAEQAFKFYQKTLSEFQLDINEEKTEISKTPFSFDTMWSIELGNFKFRINPKSQITDLERFTSLSFDFAINHPKDSVLLFSIQVLKGISLYDENWDFYESVILKILLTEPRTFDIVAQILCSNKSRVNKNKLKSVLVKIIENHIPKGHNFETSWALTICKEFKIKLRNNTAKLIFESNDLISILVALDLKNIGLINSSVNTSFLENELIEDNLTNEYWLFVCEATYKGWLTSPTNILNTNEYFKILKDNDIYFYDELAKVPTFNVKSANKIDDKKVSTKIEYETAKHIFSGSNSIGSY